MILVSRTYWAGMPFWFRRKPDDAEVESLVVRTDDFRQIRAHWWTSPKTPSAKVAVVAMHPRIDFSHHYAIPRLLAAGIPVLAANTRHVGSDTMAEHEEMVLDLAACVRYVRERRGIERVVLLGNSGGGSLVAFYQAQASLPPGERIARSPGGTPTRFEVATMPRADGVMYVAAHRGQGKILLDAIDPSVVDEADPLAADPELDMYDPRNGFCEPPQWSTYDRAFLERYRAAQVERVRRLDATARAILERHDEAKQASEAEGFAERPEPERREVLRRRACEPIMVVYRTMANPAFVDRAIDPSPRDYGSLLSERPDLMNYAALGFARTVTARAWLSTWSGLSSNASLVDNAAHVHEPTLLVHPARDREVLPSDVATIAEAIAAKDKTVITIEDARHYFEPEPGDKDAPQVEKLMDVVVPWIQERFA